MRRYFEEEEAELKKGSAADTAAAVSGIAAAPAFSAADMADGELGRTDGVDSKIFSFGDFSQLFIWNDLAGLAP